MVSCGANVLMVAEVHNNATSWPNLHDCTCKNLIQIEFQVGPECGNMIDRIGVIFGFKVLCGELQRRIHSL